MVIRLALSSASALFRGLALGERRKQVLKLLGIHLLGKNLNSSTFTSCEHGHAGLGSCDLVSVAFKGVNLGKEVAELEKDC